MGPKRGEKINTRHMRSASKQWIVLLATIIFTSAVYSNPVLDNIAAGNVSIQQEPNSTVINQSSQKAIINWQSFNIGQPESVHFQQPAGGVALNRINPTQGPSSIYGRLTATGQIILMNPAGIFFGPTAYVNVGGLIATTGNITDQEFLNGSQYHFTNVSPYSGSIINEGQLIAMDHGLIALVGNNVQNKGVIQANMGKVVLGSGSAFTMNFDGTNLINFTVNEKALGSARGVANTGAIMANGGQVLVTAKAAQDILDNVINLEGVVQAKSVSQQNGEIILSGDADGGVVRVASNIDVSGKGAGEKGGQVNITGYNVLIDSPTTIDASGDAGGGNIFIGGNAHGAGPLPNANATVMLPGTNLYANAITSGNGGNIVLWSQNVTKAYGNISATGGAQSGNGGFIETSGDYLDVNGINVNTAASNGNSGSWLLDPASNIYIAASQANATAAGMSGTDNSASTATGVNPKTFAASGSVQDSFLLTTTLTTTLNSVNVIVTTSNGSGTGVGNIFVVDPISWAKFNGLTLIAANNININAAISDSIAATLTLNAAGTITQTAAIGGLLSLDKQGAGTLVLSQANTFTGATTIEAGTIQIANSSAFPSTNTVQLFNNNTTFDLNGFNLTLGELSDNITNSSIKLGSGTLTVGDSGDFQIFSTVISGTGNLIKQGSGRLTLGSQETYTGSTTINGGTILYATANVLANSSSVTLANTAGVTLDLSGFNTTLASLSGGGGTGGNVNLGSGILETGDSSNTTFGGVISGSGSLIKDGSGTFTLTGSNTYSGSTTISAGTLSAQNATALGTTAGGTTVNGTLDINGVAIGAEAITLNGTLTGTGTSSLSGNISLGSNSSIGGTGTLTLSGVISGASKPLTKADSGTLILSGTNTYTGITTINAGTLQLGTANAISSSSAVSLANISGATFDLNGNNETIASLSGGGSSGGNVTLGSAILTTGDSSNTTFSGVISGTGGLIKQGSGTFTLSNTANTYTGQTTINNGMLSVAKLDIGGNNSSLGATAASTPILLGSSTAATLSYTGGTDTTDRLITINGSGGGTIQATAAGTLTLSGNISGGGNGLTFDTNTGNITASGVISGNGTTITKTGSGSLGLTNSANTYTGQTTINNGTLSVAKLDIGGNNSSLGATAASTPILLGSSTAAILSYTGGTDTTDRLITINGSGGGTIQATAAGTLTLSGNISGGGNGLTFDANTGSITTTGIISGSGTTLTKTGTGSLGLNNIANTYTGQTSITNGTVNITKLDIGGNNSSLGATAASTAILLGNSSTGATLSYSGGTDTTDRQFTIGTGASSTIQSTSAGTLTLSGAISLGNTLVFDANGGNITASGVISGSGGLTKNGTQTLTLSNTTNSYTGQTNIAKGTLSVSKLANGGSNSSLGATLASTPILLGSASAATLSYTGGTDSTDRQITINGAGNGTIQATAAGTLTLSGAINGNTHAITFDTNTGNITASGVISGTSTTLTKTSSGTLNLSGNNTYTGLTTISAGTLSAQHANALGTTAAGTTVTSGATLDINGVAIGNEAVTVSGTGVGGNGALTGTGTGSLSGGITFAGNTTIGGTGSLTLSGIISETFVPSALTKIGSGTLNLSGANTYTGATNANVGTLSAQNANALGTTAAGTTVASGATLDINGVAIGNEALTISGTGVGGNGVLTGTGAGSLSGAVTLAADSTIGGTGTLTLSGAVGESGGSRALTKAGSGTFTLSGANTYTGATTINAGTLSLGNNSAIGTGTLALNGGTLSATASRTLANSFTVGGTATIGGSNNITINGTGTLSSGSLTNSNSSTTTLNGALSGSGAFNQNAGTLVLSGNNSNYTGTFSLNTGTLSVSSNQALGSSAITVGSGTTLNLNNVALSNNVTLSNGTLSSSGGASSLSGTVTLASGSTNTIDAGTLFTFDNNVTGSGALTLQGAGGIRLNGDVTSSSLTANTDLTLGGSTIETTGAQTYNNPLTLAGVATLTSTGSTINIGSTVNGGFALDADSAGILTMGGAIGGSTALSSVDLTGSSISLNGGSVTTTDNQTYTGTVALGADTTFTSTGSNPTIAFNNGISGNKNVTLAGGASSNETFMLSSTITANNVTVNGNTGGTNTLQVDSGNAQNWNITANNTGNITGVAGVGGNFNYNNIQNITGGESGNNTFVFSDGARLSGNINGGSTANTNTLNFAAFTTPMNITLSSTNNGTVSTDTLGTIAGFTNMTDLVNNALFNTITLSSGKTNTMVVTSAKIGSINDPINFNGFQRFIGSGNDRVTLPSGSVIVSASTGQVIVNGVSMYFIGFLLPSSSSSTTTTGSSTVNVASIIEPTNDLPKEQNAITTGPNWLMSSVTQNITDIIQDIQHNYDETLSKVKINPYCYKAN